MKLTALPFTTILIALKLTVALSILPSEGFDVITIDYCEASECPGCPPRPLCDCAPATIALAQASSDILVAEPTETLPVQPEQAVKWYRPSPRKLKRVKPVTPVEPAPCICPLILCAEPPLCEC